MFDIFAGFRERACVWQNKEFSQACLVRECIRSRGGKSDSGLARARKREESVQRERVSAKSDSQLVVAHINACHGYLTREDMWVGQGVIVDLVSGSF